MEGEGSFGWHSGSPRVSAAQVQREPIDRLVAIFGGSVYQRWNNGFGSNPLWVWRMSARRSIQVMMTLYVLMSPKRQAEIASAIINWRSARSLRSHNATHCLKGHALKGQNLFMAGKYRKCRACMNRNSKRWRDKQRSKNV
jgi:hypothetical protein